MTKYESAYVDLVRNVLANGDLRATRNQNTLSLFGMHLTFDLSEGVFPLLEGRKMFYKGVFGELAAMLRKPKHIDDFTKWGCNFWNKWADPVTGAINVDYGNAWFQGGQIERLKDSLRNNPNDRRMIINGWVPENLDDLSLPCCHYSYQFYVSNGKLSMLWNQRSVDVMIGLPSDAVFAAAWLIMLANEFGYEPGKVTMNFGDTHIYEGHKANAEEYIRRVHEDAFMRVFTEKPGWKLLAQPGKDFLLFTPDDIAIKNYSPLDKLEFELYD